MVTGDAALFARVRMRVMPILVLCFLAAYIDRANLGFAAIAMNAKYGFTATVYGWAAGIFFIGYTLVEIPSNLILTRVGARLWIARIMITWGIISSCTAFVWNAESLYVARFLLGVAEAGFVPGVLIYLARWFPDSERGRAVGWFQCGGPISSIVASPISGLIMAGQGAFGLENWQFLFVIEGLPSIIMGIVVLVYLSETPDDATWLSPAERDRLKERLALDRCERDSHGIGSFKAALTSPRIILLSLAWLLTLCGSYAVLLWLPLIVKSLGASNAMSGWLVAVPYVMAVIAIVVWTRHSDRSGERTWHFALPCFVAAICLCSSYYIESPVVAFIALAIAASSIWATVPTFWTLPASVLGGTAAAGGFAFVNSIGNLGGFLGPYAVGYVKDQTGSFPAGLVLLGVCLAGAGLIVAALSSVARRPEPALNRAGS
jgi:ACS family tartrate transporter-like MFS transporter